MAFKVPIALAVELFIAEGFVIAGAVADAQAAVAW